MLPLWNNRIDVLDTCLGLTDVFQCTLEYKVHYKMYTQANTS